LQYKFQIKNEEAQKHWQASRLEEDAAEHFRFGGEYREMDLYLLKRGVLNFWNTRNDKRVIKWTYYRNQYENGTEKKKGVKQHRKTKKIEEWQKTM
jgi:hypothetical protein